MGERITYLFFIDIATCYHVFMPLKLSRPKAIVDRVRSVVKYIRISLPINSSKKTSFPAETSLIYTA